MTKNNRVAFTLVEMLVAMAVTLLMMAAVARGFAFVGERVRDSRANLQLSADLLDVTNRLRNELRRCTVKMTPNLGEPDQAGYFLYNEGPVTDVTSSIFRASGTTSDPLLLDSRYGDFDDYLAFTAVAPAGSWFTGKVPRYLLDQKATEVASGSYTLPTGPYNASNPDPFAPVVIRSKYAEIVYFASPEYEPASLPAAPVYVDVDGDTNLGSGTTTENGLPDRLRIHRRVLLIRPDLNMNVGRLPIQSKVSGSITIPFMRADTWPTGTNTTLITTSTPPTPPYSAPILTDAYLYGMAGVHQQCDLSLRRVNYDTNGLPRTEGYVAANSLADLSKPHNRFAHVRVPQGVLTGGSAPAVLSYTSMPILALGPPATILNSTMLSSATSMAPSFTPNAGPVVTPSRYSGFLRPEFVLGNDHAHYEIVGDGWGLDRLGEDLLVNNVIGFDLKIYDPSAVSFVTSSTNLIVGPSDAGYREELIQAINAPGASLSRGQISGGFVDLAYPVLAGGSLRGWQARPLDRLTTGSATLPTNWNIGNSFLETPFSGVSLYTNTTTSLNAYTNSLARSGRLVVNGTSPGSIYLFQPAFDTYTSYYETDGFRQYRALSSEGTIWSTTTGDTADLGSDGLDSDGIYGSGLPAVSGGYGPDDLGEHETQPPFIAAAQSIEITFRLENPKTRQIRQLSVVHRDAR